jgi:hypothetical protein
VEYAKEKFAGLPIRFIDSREYWQNVNYFQRGDWNEN